MAKNKISWYKKGIEELQYRYGFSEKYAKSFWESAYRKALRQTRKEGLFSSSFNVSREVYASAFYDSKGLYDIHISDTGISVSLEGNVSGKQREVAYVKNRFEKLANRYSEVDYLLNEYENHTKILSTVYKNLETQTPNIWNISIKNLQCGKKVDFLKTNIS